jgi:hypothetical protein
MWSGVYYFSSGKPDGNDPLNGKLELLDPRVRERSVSNWTAGRSAELLGFIAIAVVLADLKTDRVLRSWDLVAAIGIAAASLYPSPTIRAIGMTCLGLFFIAHTDRRIGSLGQLCLGLVWIDFWGARQTRQQRRIGAKPPDRFGGHRGFYNRLSRRSPAAGR